MENDDYKSKELLNQQLVSNNEVMNNKIGAGVPQNNVGGNNELDLLTTQTMNLMNNMKIVSKKVEINTKITYTYEDGSTKVVTQNETHEFKE